MKLIGYINTNGYFPSPLTMITLDSRNDYFLRYPNGERYPISLDRESIYSDSSVLLAASEAEVDDKEFAYGLSKDNIVFGSGEEVKAQLTMHLDKDHLSDTDRELVELFLTEYSYFEDDKRLKDIEENWYKSSFPRTQEPVSLKTVADNKTLVVYFSDRVVVTHGRRVLAKRLLVQFEKNGSTKTAYRKNIDRDFDIAGLTVPYQAVRPFLGGG